MQKTRRNGTFKLVAAAATVTAAAAMITIGAPSASAADKSVQITGEAYGPQDAGTMSPGDTITWKNSGVHDVKSARIPAGATAWASPIQQGAATFSQSPTKAGNYRYYCTLHSDVAAANAATQDPGQMVGQFTVGAGAPAPAGPAPAAPAPAAPAPAAPAPAAPAPEAPAAPAPEAPAAPAPEAPVPAAADAQVPSIPTGGVQAGGGSTAGFDNTAMMKLGGGLLIAAFLSALLGWRVALKD